MSNILKQYRVAGEDKNVRVINSNSMIKQFFADSISHPADSYTGISSDAQSSLEKTKSLSPDTQESGFNDGINAAVVTEIDVSAEKERLLEEAKLEADSILDKAKAEASRLLDEAKQRAQILYADNKSKGYEDGLAECQREFDEKEISLRQELSDKESSLKSKYDAYSKELESDLIDAIIQVFNKVFKIQFDDKKDILFHLVENTMSNIEVGKEFRIHVAYSNYKFMMSHLDEIQERIGNDIDIEVVDEAIKSLELGAFDFVTKPNNIIEAKGNQFKETLLRVVYAAVRITPAHSASRNLTVVEKKAGAIVNKHKAAGSNKIVAIASSTGGPKALQSVIPFLPAELLAPVVLVQHMPAGFTKSMAERLNELSQVQVKEASNGEVLKNGVVYIAPGGTHIAIKKSGASHVISFNDMPPISGLKPCANIMFDSLTSSNYDEVVCVVLTGMGADGTNGILSLGKSKPIYVIAQDEKSSVVYGMPRAIYEAGVVDEVVTLSDVAKAITKNVGVK